MEGVLIETSKASATDENSLPCRDRGESSFSGKLSLIIAVLFCLAIGSLVWFLWRTSSESSRSRFEPWVFESVDYRKPIDKLLSTDQWITPQHRKINEKTIYSKSHKLVLIYTAFFDRKPWLAMENDYLPTITEKCKCKYKGCTFTYDQKLLQKSAAVIFHGKDLPSDQELFTLRRHTALNQQWAFFTSDPPTFVDKDLTKLNGIFNLTMTYQEESDVWSPFGVFLPWEDGEKPPPANKNYAAGKKPGAAWVVSHCAVSHRDTYVRKLQELYPVYVGGHCRHNYKKQMNETENYDNEIKRKYKYYLSFENSFCKSYITEKYWQRGIENEVIPIVMGAAPYEKGPYGAVPGSYINVEAFQSVEELAAYLHYLDGNDDAYNEYFTWKQAYKTLKPPHGPWLSLPCSFVCGLCQVIHAKNYPVQSYDIHQFFSMKDCYVHGEAVDRILGYLS